MKRPKICSWQLLPFFICLILSFPSCPGRNKNGTPYFPLAVNNRWVYDYLALDWDEGEVDTIETGQVEILISQKDTFQGKELYQVVGEITTESDTFSITLFWEAGEKGIFQYESLPAVPDTFLLLPLEKGKLWQIASLYLLLIRDDPYYYEATSKGTDTVKVRDEKFSSAQKIEYTSEEINGAFWLVKEIGLVKLVDKEGEPDCYTEFIFNWKREE